MSRRNVPERASATAQEKAALTSTNTAAVDVDDLDAWGVFKKALIFQGQWNKETFPQFLDVIYWFRQVLALVIGVVWGRAASRGGTAIMSFAALVRRLRKST
ncbi:hypothetical protein Naga_100002g134 [Nannochloropsis gaditana]|uniref:Uncharacterized protein n=1 Tax=Nannochloropsis gaditana TaxID=72520 RepID=W7TNF2_9STRA|nr:hypothetical protein Naga_100002g134 [Nannochloropsis gaditana]